MIVIVPVIPPCSVTVPQALFVQAYEYDPIWPAPGMKFRTQGRAAVIRAHGAIPSTSSPPIPWAVASAAGVVHVITYAWPTLRFTLLDVYVQCVPPVVVALMPIATGAELVTMTSRKALLEPPALSTNSADL